MEEQNAYIEVVWKNKGGESVEFSIDNNPVTLSLNGQGQGWIVVPAGKSFTCAALGITEAKTTVKGNIYGITREFSAVPEGYVDLGVTVGTQHIYFEKGETDTQSAWQAEQEDWPTVEEWPALKDQCYCKLADGRRGYYVFKIHDNNDAGKVTTYKASSYIPSVAYSTATEPYIFLPITFSYSGYYWSSEFNRDYEGYAYCLLFDEDIRYPGYSIEKDSDRLAVVTVRRSN